MINFDTIIQSNNHNTYKNISPFYPQHPFRCLIVACSGAGKTNDLLNIIHNSVFHKIFVYSKTLDEEKYQFLINVQKQKEQLLKKQGISENLIHFSTDIADAVPLENLDKNYQHLYIFDDICLESSKEQEKYIGDLYIRSRKFNASVVYISQSYFKIPKIIRDNASFIVLKKINDERELKTIHSIYANHSTLDEFLKKYHEAVMTYSNHGSLIIDNVIKFNYLKLRANYVGVFLINS
jgi:hypothetical protein